MVYLERDEEYIEARWAASVGACFGVTISSSERIYKVYPDRNALLRGGQPEPRIHSRGEW